MKYLKFFLAVKNFGFVDLSQYLQKVRFDLVLEFVQFRRVYIYYKRLMNSQYKSRIEIARQYILQNFCNFARYKLTVAWKINRLFVKPNTKGA